MSALDTVRAKAEDLLAEIKTVGEQAIAPLEALQSSKIAQVAEKYVLGPDQEQFIADMVDGLAAKYGTLKAAPADTTTPAADPPAEQAA